MELYYHFVDRDVLVLSADGGIDSRSAEQMVEELAALVDGGVRRLLVDCGRLDFLSSYGLAVLVRLHKKLAERGGNVKLAALDSRVTRLLALSGLDRVFQIYATVDDARAAFASERRDSPVL